MKKLLAIAAFLAAFSSLKAETEMSASIGYDSKYIFRGVALADESMTVSIDAEFDSAYLGMWTNQPITGNFDNEFDFYGGLGFDVAEGISMDVGGTLYYYPNQAVVQKPSNSSPDLPSTVNSAQPSMSIMTWIWRPSHSLALLDTASKWTKSLRWT